MLGSSPQGSHPVLVICFHVCSVTLWCVTPYDPMNYSHLDSSVRRILLAGILEWVAISSPIGHLFAENFKFTDSISLLVISASPWFSLDWLYASRNLCISSRLFNLLAYNFIIFSYDFCSSVVSFIISPISLLILFIWVLSFFFLVRLTKIHILCILQLIICFLH